MKNRANVAVKAWTAILTTTLMLAGVGFATLKGDAVVRAAPSMDGNWMLTGSLNTARSAHTATLLDNGKVLVAGGTNSGCNNATSNAEIYDPVNGIWSVTGSLNEARTEHTAALLHTGEVLAVGGYNNGRALTSAELYDPTTGTWRQTGSLESITHLTTRPAILLDNGNVLVVGTSDTSNGKAELYDPGTGTWNGTGAPLVGELLVRLNEGRVLAVQVGSPWDYASLGSALYDSATGQWSSSGFLNMFWAHTVTLLRNGKVLATGLYGQNNPTQSNIYDTNTGMWSITGNLSTFRHYGGYTATLLANGQVLVAGGAAYILNDSYVPVSAEELYDPTTGTWRPTNRLITGRNGHTATLLRNGKVLIAGGQTGSCGSPLASAELYEPETGPTTNPIDDPEFFVRQHYLDFLSREPEAGEPWSGVLNNCSDVNNDPTCDRLTVSAAFFGSPEFQLKGYFVYRFYKLAFNRLPTYAAISFDMAAVTGQTAADVFARKAAFTNAFTQRTEFTDLYNGVNNTQYVEALMGRYSLTQITTPDPANPDGDQKVTRTTAELITELNGATLTRAQVLRMIADSDQMFGIEFNRAFVAMQYFGYLRRAPEQAGFDAWLNYLNANPTDFRTMVNGFMNSIEYRLRFGPQ